MATPKAPSEWIKAGIGAFMLLLSTAIIGLFMFVREVDAKSSKQDTINAVQDEKIQRMELMFEKVIGAIDKNTDAYNELKIVIVGLKDEK